MSQPLSGITGSPQEQTLPALRALRLLGRWRRVHGAQLFAGSGCSCGSGFECIAIGDLEQDLLDHLRAMHRADSRLRVLFASGNNVPPDAESLVAMLQKLIDCAVPADAAALVLDNMEKAIASLERLKDPAPPAA